MRFANNRALRSVSETTVGGKRSPVAIKFNSGTGAHSPRLMALFKQ